MLELEKAKRDIGLLIACIIMNCKINITKKLSDLKTLLLSSLNYGIVGYRCRRKSSGALNAAPLITLKKNGIGLGVTYCFSFPSGDIFAQNV